MSLNIPECIKSKLKRKCKIKTNRKIEINNELPITTDDSLTTTSTVHSTPPSSDRNNNSKLKKSCSSPDLHSPFKNNWISTTKYTILTFIPKNLFEQFCRVANLYFLFILVLCHTPISPVAPGPSAINLGIVLLINAIKEAYEDFHRYKSDKKINNQISRVVTKEGFQEKCWKDLIVGDIVYIENEQQFPADMVLLSTSSELSAGHCYIETSNLDGETNLKCKQSLLETNHLNIDNIPSLKSTVIECESPTLNLNKFDGRITFDQNTYPLTIDQLLIRGTTLMNTKHLYGVVIYTGHETKYMLNTMATPSKRSKLEKSMNKILIFVLIVEALLCLGSALAGFGFEKVNGIDSLYYLGLKENQYGVRTVSRFFTFVVLYSTIVPISLYVTMEIVRVFQIISINKDKKMYYSETNQFANARTSNLNEELGQVEYIFSDKTGTLTRNEMEFRMCCINGLVYGSLPCEKNFLVGPGSVLNISQENIDNGTNGGNSKDNYSKPLNVDFNLQENLEFFIVLAICNTVIPEIDNNDGCGQIKYSSSSPDEIALVNASLNLGIKLVTRTPNSIGVCVNGVDKVYSILNILEFSSDRKRMSIIVRDPSTNEIVVYCKGADTSILPYLNKSNNDEKTLKVEEENLNKFSCNGLRTLCIAKKIISQQEYDTWNLSYKEASISISERDSKMETVSSEMENNFTLLGVTGIEDKLQENVTSTISTLLNAGIKVWMLTGDKQETAINIGLSCQLLNDLEILIVNDQSVQDLNVSIKNAIEKIQSDSTKQYGLVIDGKTLVYAFNSTNEQDFYDLTTMCKSVICCRVTPFQKSEVVRIVKDRTTSITLAIGDGANDVSMIQKAHIGIGISGKEGRQAVLASDFAISQFRFLERLVLVHGRYNYKRLCLLICYFFFKNLMSSLLQLWFSTNTLFSGQTFYDAVNILGYNLVFTSLPIIVMGVFEKDIDSSYLKRFPHLYKECQLGKCFNHKVFWYWIGLGIYCSGVVYYFTSYVFVEGPTNSDGKVGGLWHTSAAGFTALIFVVNLRLALVVNSWTPYHHLTIWGSLIVYGILETCYSLIFLNYTSYFHMVFLNVVGDPIFFISLIITVIVSLLPAYSVSYIKRNYFPEPIDVAQEIQRYEKNLEKKKLYNV